MEWIPRSSRGMTSRESRGITDKESGGMTNKKSKGRYLDRCGEGSGEEPAPLPLPYIVGILNSAPARMPVGQREVIAFCLV